MKANYYPSRCRTILNTGGIPGNRTGATLNPYRGCEHACVYCFARYTHEYLDRDPEEGFDREVLVKTNAAEVLRRSLIRKRPPGGTVFIGTATDPYQPAEKRFRLTRGILEVLVEFPGLSISLATKSPLAKRDVELLRDLSQVSDLTVYFSIIATDERILRQLEPGIAPPLLRFRAMEVLAAAGVRVGLFAMPVLPRLTDDPRGLEDLYRTARDSGATIACGEPLNLRTSARRRFFRFLTERHPQLVAPYSRAFRGPYLEDRYADGLSARLEELRRRHGFGDDKRVKVGSGDQVEEAGAPTGERGAVQLELGF